MYTENTESIASSRQARNFIVVVYEQVKANAIVVVVGSEVLEMQAYCFSKVILKRYLINLVNTSEIF